MSALAHVIIIGVQHRGLWLGQELVKKGFRVTWVNIEAKELKAAAQSPWQIGTEEELKELPTTALNLILQGTRAVTQESFQVLTPNGIFEFSKDFFERSRNKFFSPEASELIKKIVEAQRKKDVALEAVLRSKVKNWPKSDKWILDWQGDLRAKSNLQKSQLKGSLDSYYIYGHEGILNIEVLWDTLTQNNPKVALHKNIPLMDVGFEGRRVTGVELGAQYGFVSCDEIVLSASARRILEKFPSLEAKIKILRENKKEPEWVWVRAELETKIDGIPSGMTEFSGFVMDPYMPYYGPGFGLMKWGKRKLNLWCRVRPSDLKMPSGKENFLSELRQNLNKLIVGINDEIEAMHLITEHAGAVYKATDVFYSGLYKNNIWIAGPECDSSVDLVSSFKTEQKIFEGIQNKYRKELSVDRALHTPRNGNNLESRESI